MATWNASKPALTNTIAADIPDIEENFLELHDVITAITNGTLGTTTAANFRVDAITQVKTFFVPAEDMRGTATNGAATSNIELATNDIEVVVYVFDATTEEFVCFSRPMPEDWNVGTIRAKFFWYSASGSSPDDTVEWKLACVAVSDDDPLDAAPGTPQVISDAITEDGDLQITAKTPAITIGGTPASGDLVHFKISRNVGGTDDMAQDARLLGVWIQYTADVKAAAWA